MKVASPVARGQRLVARDQVVSGLYLGDAVYRFAVVREIRFVAARRELAQVLHVLVTVRLVVGEVVDARAGGVYVIGRHDRLLRERATQLRLPPPMLAETNIAEAKKKKWRIVRLIDI